jgi:hypothetical protein
LVQVKSNRLVCLPYQHVITRTCGRHSAPMRRPPGRTGRPPPASSRSSPCLPPPAATRIIVGQSPCNATAADPLICMVGSRSGGLSLVPIVDARGVAVDRSIVGKRAQAAAVRNWDGMARTRSRPEWVGRASVVSCHLLPSCWRRLNTRRFSVRVLQHEDPGALTLGMVV